VAASIVPSRGRLVSLSAKEVALMRRIVSLLAVLVMAAVLVLEKE
jgi:hypothetical protein